MAPAASGTLRRGKSSPRKTTGDPSSVAARKSQSSRSCRFTREWGIHTLGVGTKLRDPKDPRMTPRWEPGGCLGMAGTAVCKNYVNEI